MMIKIRDTLNTNFKGYRESYINTSQIEAITFIEDSDKFKIHLASSKEFRADPEYLAHILENMNN